MDISDETIARLNRIAIDATKARETRQDWVRIAAAVQAENDYTRARDCGVENVSVPRGDLGLLYQLLKDLEWSQRLHGAQPSPTEVAVTTSACPRCYGVYPDGLGAMHFPRHADGHASNCTLVAMIRLLRSALGAIE